MSLVPRAIPLPAFVQSLRQVAQVTPGRLAPGSALSWITVANYSRDPASSTDLVLEIMSDGGSALSIITIARRVHSALLADPESDIGWDLAHEPIGRRGAVMAWNSALASTVEAWFFSSDGPALRRHMLDRLGSDGAEFLGDGASVAEEFATAGESGQTPKTRRSVYEPNTSTQASWFGTWCQRYGRARLAFHATVAAIYHDIWELEPPPTLPGPR